MWRTTCCVLVCTWMAACSSIGPRTVTRDRVDYVNAIGTSWERETLLNIVKLRYGHAPIFFSVTQVVTGYQFQSTVSGGVTASSFNPVTNVFGIAGTATAQGQYTDRPTVIYTPLTGIDFLQKLMTPIPPGSVLFMLQAGYDAQLLLPLMLDSVNGINNRSWREKREADPRFTRVAQLIRELQIAGALQFRIENPKKGAETSVVAFSPTKDPQVEAERDELRDLLGLGKSLDRFDVYYGGYSGKNNEISMMTRSMLEVLLELAAGVKVPESDVSEGRVTAGLAQDASGSAAVNILSGREAPKDASIAVQYNELWFWVPDTDIRSKSVFGTVMLLFSISDIGVKGTGPIVTVPANG